MILEFGYNKTNEELIIFKNGDDIGYINIHLDDDDLETIKYELEEQGTYFIVYNDY